MDTGNIAIDAQSAFARERRRHQRERAKRWLLGRRAGSGRLVSLEQELGTASPASVSQVGLRAIPLDSIVGTAESAKAQAFDGRFRPPATSRGRWERLWAASRAGAPLPPISVFRIGDRHFVNDGHHRVSVAQALGMSAIDAEVTQLRVSGADRGRMPDVAAAS
jgi:hypothetical protein